ncbi:MAG TPA: hypothetical protein VNF48_07150 [Gammaproteobacteria bacterium]|nr:hypothetical protein [Gammaproteobacteria bacterium]
MKHSVTRLIFLTLFLLPLGLAGCGAQGSNETNNSSLIMRTYTVPEGRAVDLSQTLNQVLGLDNYKHDVGRAWAAGPQQLLVLAPAGMQDSIATSLQQILAKSSDTAKMPLLRLNAWIVDVYPGRGPTDPSLKSIQPALEAFSQDMGPAHFVQAHYFTAVSDVGSHTLLMPLNLYHLSYTLARSNGGLIFNFQYGQPANDKGGYVQLNGQVTVQLAQNLVLGLISDRPAEHSGIGLVHRLLVVRIAPANQG